MPSIDDTQSALDVQIGGSHYKDMAIQPMEFSMANGLDACQHTVVKYVTRFKSKGGIQDLEKAKHVIDMMIEFERSKAAEPSTKTIHESIRAYEAKFKDDRLKADKELADKVRNLSPGVHVIFVDEESGETD